MNIDWPKYNEIFYTVMNRQQPSDYASMTRSERRTRDTIIHQKGRGWHPFIAYYNLASQISQHKISTEGEPCMNVYLISDTHL